MIKVDVNTFNFGGIKISKHRMAAIAAALLWYFSLFPGRLGSDPAQAIALMRKGESTDWWTALYFWVLRITTFEGKSIWLASLISITFLFTAIVFFLDSLPENKAIIDKALLIVCILPIFGNFAVNINHDTYFASGILFTLGYIFRKHYSIQMRNIALVELAISFLLLNSRTGYAVLVVFMCYLLFSSTKRMRTIFIMFLTILIYGLSTFGISKTTIPLHLLSPLADVKCVVQHPEAKVSENEWEYLTKYWSKENWRDPVTCSSVDTQLENFPNKSLEKIDSFEFTKLYFSLLSKNPAIVIQAHLQRASIALPPPFFHGPQNQVDLNIQNPVGLGTNIALQNGPNLLHPSIDDVRLNKKPIITKPFEATALFTSFLFNQASDFWGWGGLWLWSPVLYLIKRLKVRKVKSALKLMFPLLMTHLVLLATSPIPAPRYVMSTILVGNILVLIMLISGAEKLQQKEFK